MLGFLYSWVFWIILVVVLLVILWIFFGGTKVQNYYLPDGSRLPHEKKRKRRKAREEFSTETVTTSSFGTPIADLASPIPIQVCNTAKRTATSIFSSRDAIASSQPASIGKLPPLPPQFSKPADTSTQASKKETLVREILWKVYGVDFVTVRPDWLKNPATGRNLEIDLYNDELKLGVEVHGEQHYFYTPRFHRSEADYKKQVARDQLKLDICDSLGVYIITIPYFLPDDRIEEYIRYYDPATKALRDAREIQLAMMDKSQEDEAVVEKKKKKVFRRKESKPY